MSEIPVLPPLVFPHSPTQTLSLLPITLYTDATSVLFAYNLGALSVLIPSMPVHALKLCCFSLVCLCVLCSHSVLRQHGFCSCHIMRRRNISSCSLGCGCLWFALPIVWEPASVLLDRWEHLCYASYFASIFLLSLISFISFSSS
ncbi:hypothetical protein FB446DRAFT_738382 [Lentinula raphanica]|nr:hypothetical protein FB446DRAFT_738382 [Lentinula raphanica]